MQEFAPEIYEKIIGKYLPACARALRDRPKDMQVLMVESYSMAMQILGRLDGIPTHEIVASVYVFCKDEDYQFVSKQFEFCIESAALTPDKFVAGLHKWCNAMSSKLKKSSDNMKAFCSFANQYQKLMYTKTDVHVRKEVIASYMDLIHLLAIYMRPAKFDNNTALAGITTEGKPLSVNNPYGTSIMIPWEVNCAGMGIKGYQTEYFGEEIIHQIAAKWGFPQITTTKNVTALTRDYRFFQNIVNRLLPYINEYTYDILPKKFPSSNFKNLGVFRVHNLDMDAMRKKLSSSRRRTLPVNGVQVHFEDPTEYIKQLLLKEIVVDDEVIMLYKISIDEIGDVSGYYNTASDYLYSLSEEVDSPIFKTLDALVLYCYATAVLDDETYSDANIGEHFSHMNIFHLKAESVGLGGKLKKTDGSEPHTERDLDKYDAKQKVINGFIRRLPEGQTASEEAAARAKKMGYHLQTNETYVAPFSKTIFYLKKKKYTKEDAPDLTATDDFEN